MIEIQNISKKRGNHFIFKNVNLIIEKNTVVALLGPSGSGKTTLLRLIAGLSKPCAGIIRISENTVSTPHQIFPPGQRDVSMVFQSLALWPHMTAIKHLEFVSHRFKHKGKKQIRDYLQMLLDGVQLGAHSHKYPDELSGGEQQRLAIARAMASFPDYLLMDEPFSHLDDALREELIALTLSIKADRKITILYVTHHIDEALMFSDKIVVLKNGHLFQIPKSECCNKDAILEKMKTTP